MCSGDIHKKYSSANSQLVCVSIDYVMHLLTKNIDALVLEVASVSVWESGAAYRWMSMQNKECYPGIAERNIEAWVFGMVWFLGPLVINGSLGSPA